MSGRENILRRVHEAVARPAAKLFEEDVPRRKIPWYPPVAEGHEAMRDRFAEELTALRGEFMAADDTADAAVKTKELVGRFGFKQIAAQDTEIVRHAAGGVGPRWLGADIAAGRALRDVDLAITGCDALVAMTGSVLLTALSAGGRAMSVLPPNHLVIARREQLAPDLASALRVVQEKHNGRMPSFVSLVTGPSRTSDIEKMLVLGAHGPKRLFVMLVG